MFRQVIPLKFQEIQALRQIQFPREFFQIQCKLVWFPVKFHQLADFQIQCKLVWFPVKYPQVEIFRVQFKLGRVTVEYTQLVAWQLVDCQKVWPPVQSAMGESPSFYQE